MKVFNVGFYYEQSGTCTVEAYSLREAEEIFQKQLEENGIDGLKFKIANRDYNVTSIAQINSNVNITPSIKYKKNIQE